MKHTPEPWSVDALDYPQFGDAGDIYVHTGEKSRYGIGNAVNICSMIEASDDVDPIANAEHIVACVNALAGIDDPAAFVVLSIRCRSCRS